MSKLVEKKLLIPGFVAVLMFVINPVLSVEDGQKLSGEHAPPRQVIEQLYDYFATGNMDGILTLLHPEVVFILHGPKHQIPWAGTFKGHAGVKEFFYEIDAAMNLTAVTQERFLIDGEFVHVIGRDIGIMKNTGGAFNSAHLHSWQVKNGKIVRLEEITDTADLADALAPADPVRGKAYFTTCAACHGLQAEGNSDMHAPRLTLQDSGYLLRQLRYFRDEIRGGVNDFYGWQMNGRALGLPDDRAYRDVLAYISTLPDTKAENTLDGSVRNGKRLYKESCASCHGLKAEGNPQLSAPVLAGMDDWYQLEQLRKFKDGTRGSHKDDTVGIQMRAIMSQVKDEKAMKDIIKYIGTIK